MWYGPGDVFEMREFGFDGRLLRIVRLDRPARAVTETDIAAHQQQLTESLAGDPRAELLRTRMIDGAVYAPYFPAHYELMMDDAGHLWVQDYQPFDAGLARVWSVFDPRGRYLGDVEVPAGLYVHHIGADYVIGEWTDDLDVEFIRAYEIQKPSTGAN